MIVSRRIGTGVVLFAILVLLVFSLFFLPGTSRTQIAFNPNAKTAKEAIDFVVMANRVLSHEGILDAYGHVSVRNPENPKTFFITRAVAPELVTPKDILEVDLDGNVVTKTTMRPYEERIIHASIYKARPDVNSVVHTHTAPIVAFSVSKVPLRPVEKNNGVGRFYPSVPVYDEADFTSPGNTRLLVTSKEQSEHLVKCLGSGPAVLMRGHGYTVVGSNVPDAVNNAISLRDNAVILLMALQLGTPKYLTSEETVVPKESGVLLQRAWDAWVHRVKDAMPDMR